MIILKEKMNINTNTLRNPGINLSYITQSCRTCGKEIVVRRYTSYASCDNCLK